MGPSKPNRTDEVADMLFGDLDMPAAGDEPTAEGHDPLAQAGLGASPLGRVLDGGPAPEQTLIDLPPDANRRLQETTAGAPAPYRPLPSLPAPAGRAATPATLVPTATAIDPPSAPAAPARAASSAGAKTLVDPPRAPSSAGIKTRLDPPGSASAAKTLTDEPKPTGIGDPAATVAPSEGPPVAATPLAPAPLPSPAEASAWAVGASPSTEPPPSAPDPTAPPILSGQRATPTMVIRADKALERGRAVRQLEKRLGQTNLKVEDKPVPASRPSSLPLVLAILGVLVVLGAAYTWTRRGPSVETMAIEASPIEVSPSEPNPSEAPAVAAAPAPAPEPPPPVAPTPPPPVAPTPPPPPAAAVVAAPAPPPVPMVELTLKLTPPDATIAIDGEPVTPPIARPKSKTRHTIEIAADGHRSERREWVAKASASWVVRLRPLPKPRVAKAPAPRPAAKPTPPVAPASAPETVSAVATPPPEEAPAPAPPPEAPAPPVEKAPAAEAAPPPAAPAPPPTEKSEPAPDVAFLSISGKVWGAEVQVDGRVVGMVPIQGLALKSGMHTVWVSMSGYEVFVTDVKLAKGEKRAVVAELVPIPPADF